MAFKEDFSELRRTAYTSPAYQRPDSGLWLITIQATERIFHERGKLLIGVNTIMRILDDIADGDLDPPKGYTRVGYLQERRKFIQNPNSPEDKLDSYALHCINLAHSLGFDISEDLDDFFNYFIFDASRLKTSEIFPKTDLDDAYNACARATIRGMLKLLSENPDKSDLFSFIGQAVRIHYTLRDFEVDISKGLVNIPLEAFDENGINPEGPLDRFSPGVRRWFHNQAELGLNLLEQHQKTFREGRVPLLARIIPPLLYVRSARACFEEVLSGRK